MALHLVSTVDYSDRPAAMPRLDVTVFGPIVREYIAARALKKKLEAEARAADSTRKSLRDRIYAAMSGAPAALCGNTVLAIKNGAPAPAALTLTNGRKIPWKDVTVIKVGKETIDASMVSTIFGGREGSVDIEATATD